jgi:CHAD domain-containing protein
MRVFRPAFGRDALAPFVEDLRWLAAGLGRVRDEDVFLEWLDSYRANAPQLHQRALRTLRDHHASKRQKHLDSLVKILDDERYRQFVESFRVFLQNHHAAGKKGKQRVGKGAPQLIRRRWKRVHAFDVAVQNNPSPETLHSLRIAGKKLRYTAEFFRGCYEGKLEPLIADLAQMQDALGGVHDVDVHVASLEAYLATLENQTAQRAVRGAITQRRTEQTALRAQFDELWQRGLKCEM